MKSLFFSILAFSTAPLLAVVAQPATEVYLFDLVKGKKGYELKNGLNVSANPGQYDNQPSFSKNGTTLYYVSQDTAGQNDIYFYSIKNALSTNFSQTPDASEYSPTLTPDGKFISCIRVVGDEQLLWKFPLAGGEPAVVVPNLVIGYHAWRNNRTLVSFVLGEPQTLQVSDLNTGTNKIVAENIGRSLHKIPGTELISIMQNRDDQPALIQSLNPETGEINTITEALADSQDMAWTPDGEIVMGRGSTLHIWTKKNSKWVPVAEVGQQFGLTGISRLAVSPDGKKIAVVVNE